MPTLNTNLRTRKHIILRVPPENEICLWNSGSSCAVTKSKFPFLNDELMYNVVHFGNSISTNNCLLLTVYLFTAYFRRLSYFQNSDWNYFLRNLKLNQTSSNVTQFFKGKYITANTLNKTLLKVKSNTHS